MNDRELLKEATALLERVTLWRFWEEGGSSDDELQQDAKDWLASRAPAPPAAPTHRTIDIDSDVTPDKRARLEESRELAQSGAIIFGDDLSMHPGTGRLIRSKPTPMAAAPEPSGAFDCIPGETDRQCAVRWMRQCMSAEAQLAAVLMTVEGIRGYMHSTLADSTFVLKGPTAQRVRDLVASLLTAPSPGAGEETL